MENLAVGSYLLENGYSVFKLDIFLIYLFDFQRKKEGIHSTGGISKNELGEVLGVTCKCGFTHPFIEGKINWEINLKTKTMGKGYVIYSPELDLIDFEYGKPEGHMVIGEPLESDYGIADGNIRIPIEKFTYAVNCVCGKSHPIENRKVLWDKIFKKKWDRNEL